MASRGGGGPRTTGSPLVRRLKQQAASDIAQCCPGCMSPLQSVAGCLDRYIESYRTTSLGELEL